MMSTENTIETGLLVVPKPGSGKHLRSGAEAYHYAVVASTEPLILISGKGDMVWTTTFTIDDVIPVGTASQDEVAAARERMQRDGMEIGLNAPDATKAQAPASAPEPSDHQAEIEKLRAELHDLRMDMDIIRNALEVPPEPAETLRERLIEAANFGPASMRQTMETLEMRQIQILNRTARDLTAVQAENQRLQQQLDGVRNAIAS